MPKYGELKLTSEAADALKERAEAQFEAQKNRARGAILELRKFVEAKIGNSASNYYNAIEPRSMMRTTLDPILKAFSFDPDDGTLYEFDKTRMNAKTIYTITDTRSTVTVKVSVCFEPLTANDQDILRGEDWQTARFVDVWKELAVRGVAEKLTLCDGIDKPILGLVQIGTVQRSNNGERILRDSLLEAAPVYRQGIAQRRYTGIGRVLIARLIVESKAQGAEGRLLVRPVPASIPFYRKLGFREARIPPYFRLAVGEAEALLQECTRLSLE